MLDLIIEQADVILNCPENSWLPGNLYLYFLEIEGKNILHSVLDHIVISAGSVHNPEHETLQCCHGVDVR